MSRAADFDWMAELEKTVVSSLATSFGLDFLLFEDKVGGNVDTIHNVRQGVWATDKERQAYDNRGDYDSDAYHKHDTYKETGRRDKQAQQDGKLYDPYRNVVMGRNEQRNLDHVISAKEVHDDAGWVLAGLSGVDLANKESNLQSTSDSVNKSKNKSSVNEYLDRLPNLISANEMRLEKDQRQLEAMPRDTSEQRHKARELEDSIRKGKEKLNRLKAIDPDEMKKRDKAARDAYEKEVNIAYYTSSKFLQSAAMSAGTAGVAMGTRQVLGLVMAEIWFELRAQLPKILDDLRQRFDLEKFLESIGSTLSGIWVRVKERFADFIEKFKDGVFAGVLSDLTTTLINIFFTTQRMVIKLIREMWNSVVQAFKVLVFNPENLSTVEVMRSTSNILSLGIATAIGSTIYGSIAPALTMPFGGELAAFIGAFSTGLITLGFQYFINHSPVMKPLWDFLEKSSHLRTLQQFQAVNAQLDEYLEQLAKVEFNMDAEELADFAALLSVQKTELERGFVLTAEVERRGIELPYVSGNPDSVRQWLASKI